MGRLGKMDLPQITFVGMLARYKDVLTNRLLKEITAFAQQNIGM
jgi:hypothetical protein